MRGSPLIRFILLALALAATGLGLLRVTARRSSEQTATPLVVIEKPANAAKSLPFRLQLSAPATEVEINTGQLIRPPLEGSLLVGSLELDSENPRIGLVVRWKTATAPGEHRFAKLTLEAPGQATFTHVFDANGDIDDFLELPLPAVK